MTAGETIMADIGNIQEENPEKPIGNGNEQPNKHILEQPTVPKQESNHPTPENSKSESMEVHHHPQVEKKNLKEYLLEGLMIFVAVTLGFFAETIREHIS